MSLVPEMLQFCNGARSQMKIEASFFLFLSAIQWKCKNDE